MKVVKVVSRSRLQNATCLTEGCPLNYTGEDAEGRAYSHADDNDGHRVKVTESCYMIYERKEMT